MHAQEPRAASAPLAERYRVLLEIGHTLAGTLDSDDLYRALHRETVQVIDASGFYVSLYEADTDTATVVFYADEGGERKVSVRYAGTESEAIRSGAGVIESDPEPRPWLPPVDGDEPRSSISAPLRYKGRTVGALTARSAQPGAFGEEDLELLCGIADIAAVALENARVVSELERRRREAEEVEEIGRALTSSLDTEEVMATVAEAVLRIMPEVVGSTVWLLEGTVARVTASAGAISLPMGASWDLRGSIYEGLVEDRTSVIVPDLAEKPVVPGELRHHLPSGSGLAVPLTASGDVVGVLWAGSREPRAFSLDHVVVLVRIARQASVALENARLHSDIRSLSLTDPLTEIPNRRHLQMHLEREVAAARRGRHLVLVMFDLDNFKDYNDAAGHVAGDEALRTFARCLSKENRAMNLVARYGGDEFVSVLSDSSVEGAREYVARVHERMEAEPVFSENGITVSTGIAPFDPEKMTSMTDLIQAADRQLYQEKDDRMDAHR